MIMVVCVWLGVLCHVGVWLLNRKLNAVIAMRHDLLIQRVDLASERVGILESRLDVAQESL